MNFMNDRFHAEDESPKLKFEGSQKLVKQAGLASVRFPDQTKYVIIPLSPDGEWLTPNEGLEKFMKLVVEHCINVVDNAVLHRQPASTYTSLIKQYFEMEKKDVKDAK